MTGGSNVLLAPGPEQASSAEPELSTPAGAAAAERAAEAPAREADDGIRQDLNDPNPRVDCTYAAPPFMLRSSGDKFFCPYCDKLGHFAQQCEGWAKAANWPINLGYQAFLAAMAARRSNQPRPPTPGRRLNIPPHAVKSLRQLRDDWVTDQEAYSQTRGWKVPFGVPWTDDMNIRTRGPKALRLWICDQRSHFATRAKRHFEIADPFAGSVYMGLLPNDKNFPDTPRRAEPKARGDPTTHEGPGLGSGTKRGWAQTQNPWGDKAQGNRGSEGASSSNSDLRQTRSRTAVTLTPRGSLAKAQDAAAAAAAS